MPFFDFVLANLYKEWDWERLSKNPNITWKIVKENSDKPWIWYTLSWNDFEYRNENKERIVERTRTIKEELMANVWDPEKPLGQFLVLSELDD